MTMGRYRVDRVTLDDEEEPELLGLYLDRDLALAAADAAMARLAEFLWSTRFIAYPLDQGTLRVGEHEVLLARPVPRPDEARRRAEALVDRFDGAWLVITSLRPSVRDQAREELVAAIAADLTDHP